MRASTIAAGEHVPTADSRVILYNLTWTQFEAMLRLRGDVAGPRVTYFQGALELMSPSKDHERIKSVIGSLVLTYALETDLDLSAYGAWLLKSAPREAGVEPDECYLLGSDQDRDRPDLVIEVVWTSGGLDKLEIYQRLGVPEFWQWKNGAIEIHVLRKGRYERASRSELLPGLDVAGLVQFLDYPTTTQAVRAFRASLTRPKGPRRRSPVRRMR